VAVPGRLSGSGPVIISKNTTGTICQQMKG
jgi:hypothetical protein